MATNTPTQPLPKNYADWLSKVVGADGSGGAQAKQAEQEVNEKRRTARLDKVRGEIDAAKDELQQQMNIMLLVKSKTLGITRTREVSALGPGGPDAQLDPTLDVPNVAAIPDDARRRAQQAGQKIIKLSLRAQGYIHCDDWKAVWEDKAQKHKTVPEIAEQWGVSEKTIEQVIDRYGKSQAAGFSDAPEGDRLVDQSIGDPDEVLDDLSLRKEFWDPLVREGIYPEAFVTDRYSEVVQQVTGAQKEYDARIDEMNEALTEAEERKQRLAVHAEYVASFAPIADAVAEAAGLGKGSAEIAKALAEASVAVYDNWNEKEADAAIPSIGKLIEKIVTQQFDKTYGALAGAGFKAAANGRAFRKHLLSDEPDGPSKAWRCLGDACFDACSAADVTKPFGAAAKSAFYAKGDAKAAYAEIVKLKSGHATMQDVIGALQKAASTALGAASKDLIGDDAKEAAQAAVNLVAQGAKDFSQGRILDGSKRIAKALAKLAPETPASKLIGYAKTTLDAALKLDDFRAKCRAGEWDEADAMLDEAIKAAEKQVAALVKEQKEKAKKATDETSGDELQTGEKAPEGEATDKNKDEGEGEGEGDDDDGDDGGGEEEGDAGDGAEDDILTTLSTLKTRVMAATDSKGKAQLAQQAQQANDARQQDEEAEFSAQLAAAFGDDDDDDPAMAELQQDVHSLDRMIKQVQADHALLKMGDKIFSAGVKTAAQFYEALNAAGVAKSLIVNMSQAARRYQELNQWIEIRSAALKAGSVQAEAFAGRVGKLRIDLAKNTVQSMIDLGKLASMGVAAIAAVGTAPVGGAGGVVAAGAMAGAKKIVLSAKDICLKFYNAGQLQRQWRLYQDCKQPPLDRRKMRAALRGNPTLAKYAMAYAAVEEGDPIATEGMRACGLSEANLTNAGADVAKVVTFLESKYDQDMKVLQATWSQGWQEDKSNALTLESWLKNCKKAREKNLLDSPTTVIEDALAQVQSAEESLDGVQEDCEPAKTKHDDQAAKYQPLLEVFTQEEARVEPLATFVDEKETGLATLTRTVDATPTPTETERKGFRKQLLTLDRHLTETEATLKACTKAAAAFEATIAPYLTTVDPLKTAIVSYGAAFTEYEQTLIRMGQVLSSFQPKKSVAGNSVESSELKAYAKALLKTVSLAETNLKTRQQDTTQLTGVLTEAATDAAQQRLRMSAAASKISEITAKIDTIKREAATLGSRV